MPELGTACGPPVRRLWSPAPPAARGRTASRPCAGRRIRGGRGPRPRGSSRPDHRRAACGAGASPSVWLGSQASRYVTPVMSGTRLVSADRGFARFPGLRWRRP